jgi:XTP/dITP diphosphohydrolase
MSANSAGLPHVILATGNRNKAAEITDLLSDVSLQLSTLADLHFEIEIEEDGDSFQANALKKARAVSGATGMPAIADDSGLEVMTLDGAPGIRSARFAGEAATDDENNALLLSMLEGLAGEERAARFVCVAAFVGTVADHQPVEVTFRGEWDGRIADEPAGENGFGYDPIFVIQAEGATVAQLPPEYKQRHSHRSRAFRLLADYLKGLDSGTESLD